ncbi:hypothetical protein [Natronincola ferrireducens]|uniref:Uncharacterized protein n=1 Tax=Natronincola ferrireducens TaxID=393762 RepID=A0A1G9I5W6_9FIRM|nr:hypothetical protein [Natronincola ferrireducens]SDL20650.1 hypothetical protein SAMN05660472_02808 [Natronincola ferrireducens]
MENKEKINNVTPRQIEDRKNIKIGCLTIVILACVIVSFYYIPDIVSFFNNSMEDEIKTIVGKKNVQSVNLTGVLNQEPDFLTVQIIVRPIIDKKHAIRKFAEYVVEIAEKAEKYPNINEIRIIGYVETIDKKGNKGISRYIMFTSTKEERQNVNWKKFKDLVVVDYKNIDLIGKFE